VSDFSDAQVARLKYAPELPAALKAPASVVVASAEATAARSASDAANLRTWFPRTYGQPIVNITAPQAGGAAGPVGVSAGALRVGVVFAGRQAPGGHNVVAGLHDFLVALNPATAVLGFVSGTKGLFEQKYIPVTAESLTTYRNQVRLWVEGWEDHPLAFPSPPLTRLSALPPPPSPVPAHPAQGGYHMLGRSVDKIRSVKEQEAALAACTALKLDGLVVIGGTYSNTDAGHLAEFFAARGSATRVIGVPVTIDGDVHNAFVEATVGFDTATKVYSQLVGNMATDGNSAKKYWYFVKLMGRSVSRITLEVGLQTHPNVVVLGEDIEARKLTLIDIVREVADAVCERATNNKNYGIVLVPEGAISYIPELRTLISEMNQLFADGVEASAVPSKLTPWSQAVLAYLPALIRQQLFLERESSGAVQLSQINTERLLAELVGEELKVRGKASGASRYDGKYATICSSFGYQARCSLPSNFDCTYGSTLGATAGALVAGGHNGYMATARNLAGPVSSWEPSGVPFTAMMSVPAPGSPLALAASASGAAAAAPGSGASATHGVRPAIDSAPVDVHGGAFQALVRSSAAWREGEHYANPGPIQFGGSTADSRTETLSLEQRAYMKRITLLRQRLDAIRDLIRPGVSDALLDAATSGATSLAEILAVIKQRE
jgi:diphosphate-dependent phosphofructokinase